GVRDVELQSQVAHLKKTIERTRRDERRLVELAVDDDEQRDLVAAKLRELGQRRRALAAQLVDAEAKVAAHGAASDPARIEAVCAKARRGLAKLTDAGWEALLREVVDEIRLRPDRQVEIHGVLGDVGATAAAPELSRRL